MARITEAEIANAVLDILYAEPTGEASIARLKDLVPKHVTLSADDCVQSTTRPGEELWEQQVRNITSHKDTEGNIVYDGYAEQIPGGLRITAAGRTRVSSGH